MKGLLNGIVPTGDVVRLAERAVAALERIAVAAERLAEDGAK